MEVKKYIFGFFQTNTYLLIENNDVLLIDPACKAEKLIEILKDYNLQAILLTHGHFDHLKAVDGLYNEFHCPVYLSKEDEFLARDKQAGKQFAIHDYISCPSNDLSDGKMNIGPFNFEVIHTPGHTPGSVIYVFDDCIFTGDTLFKGSVGRTDLNGGSASTLKQSLNIFKQFNKDYIIYPGHDDSSLLSDELLYNYFLQ